MRKNSSKIEAQKKIDVFFKKNSWTPGDLKKIKRLAMKYRIKLKDYKRLFCKKCLLPLRGKIRITKKYKNIACANCDSINRQVLTL
ncbi:MAG: hypothetical protein AABY00_02525 [Nanoarchaeota archaeon]